MRKLIKKIVLSLALVTIVFQGIRAQDSTSVPQIKVIKRAYPDSVVLRWAPDDPVAWQLLNEYGYTLVRKVILKDGELLSLPKKNKLTDKVIKPASLEEWEPVADVDDRAAIAAQAIYGEGFEISAEKGKSQILQVVQKTRERESRYSFALVAADISPQVARLSGLKYTDRNVREDEKYLYLVISNVPDSVMKIDTGYVYTGPGDYKPLPRPRDVKARFDDHTALISWSIDFLGNAFTAYQVERSDDKGNTFHSITNVPITNTGENKNVLRKRMFRTDSLPENGKTYMYRVRGISPFAELSPPSDTVSGQAYADLKARPKLEKSVFMENGFVLLVWSYPDSLNTELSGFKVFRSRDDQNGYEPVHKGLLPDSSRSVLDRSPMSVNYYKIVALDQQGCEYQSYPYMIQQVDSIPPKSPQQIIGNTDTSGVLQLSWKPNGEKDLLGYRVFRANYRNEAYYQVTSDPVTHPVFYDTLNLKSLTSHVFYKVVAIDRHFNQSDFSYLFQVSRPDTIPPVSPVFKDYRATSRGIELHWANSTSSDVKKHQMYRKAKGEKQWKLIFKYTPADSITSYLDTSVTPGQIYGYTLIAVDDNQQKSGPAKPLRVRCFDRKIQKPLKNLDAEADRSEGMVQLEWKKVPAKVKVYHIYKKTPGKPMQMVTSVNGNENVFRDQELKINTVYQYKIRALFSNGRFSSFSETIKIEY